MAFVPNPNVIRIVLDWTVGGLPANNVFYVNAPPPITSLLTAAAASDARSAVAINLLPIMSDDTELLSVTAYSMESPSAPVSVDTTGLPASGAALVDVNARSTSVVQTLRTANRGRSGRGRIYWPGASQNDIVDGELTPAAMTQWATAVAGFASAMQSSGFPLIVYSQFTAGDPRTVGLAQLVTTALIRSARPGVQRRREHRP